MIPPENSLDEAMHNLFTAKWNIPQAVHHTGGAPSYEEWESFKEEFREYCRRNPATWVNKPNLLQ